MMRWLIVLACSLSLTGCVLEDADADGIPDVYDPKDDREKEGELNGIDYDGSKFVTPTPTPTASPSTSPAASPTPVATPEILLSPQSVTIPYNTSANLTVLARGSNLNYQWFQGPKGSTVASVGTNSASFATGNLTASSSYWVLVGNGGAFTPSEAALVTVLDQPPTITAQPVDREVVVGTSATFTVAAAGTNLSYQWYVGATGDTASPVTGATSPIFNTGSLSEITTYWVRVSNSGDTVDSDPAVAFVVDLPEIVDQPESATIASGTRATLTVTAVSLDSPVYQWYSGVSPDQSNPVAGAVSETLVTDPLTANSSFWVKVGNLAGEVFSDTALVTVFANPVATSAPEIVSQPIPATIAAGESANLAVSTISVEDPTFQWFRGARLDESDPVLGSTSSVLNTGPLATTTTYWVKVTNSAGSVASDVATVTVF